MQLNGKHISNTRFIVLIILGILIPNLTTLFIIGSTLLYNKISANTFVLSTTNFILMLILIVVQRKNYK